MKSIIALIVLAALAQSSSAHAEGKPRKPAVFAADVCQQVALKGALGFSDAEAKPVKDRAMICQTKRSVRVLREWRVEGWGDGEMFVVGR